MLFKHTQEKHKLSTPHVCSGESHSFSWPSLTGVEFGARMVNIDGKQIKLQIWDTVRENSFFPDKDLNITITAGAGKRVIRVVLLVEMK